MKRQQRARAAGFDDEAPVREGLEACDDPVDIQTRDFSAASEITKPGDVVVPLSLTAVHASPSRGVAQDRHSLY
jgi:hypothetical protein